MSRLRIGVLGGGQLGRMMALAGIPFDIDFSFYESVVDCPATPVGKIYGQEKHDDAALQAFIDSADVFTYEFENISAELVEKIAAQKPVYPSVKSLRVSQNRLNEKELFQQLNIPSAKHAAIYSYQDLEQAVATLGLPLVIKTVTMGYDGKGQFVLRSADQIEQAWQALGAQAPLMAEQFVAFSRELSIIAVRDQQGRINCYPLTQNVHHQGILSHSVAPATAIDATIQTQAEQYIRAIVQALDHVGVMTLEMFNTPNGLVANETAPRVHNSGHWTIEGAVCSQFENHIRAVANLPIGSTQCQQPTAMINIIGQYPDAAKVLAEADAHLHYYRKTERDARKIGHITITASSHEELAQRINAIAKLLPNKMALP